MDRSSITTIILYILCFTARMVAMIVALFMDPENDLIKYIVIVDLSVAALPILANIMLTYEMRVVYLKLEANSYDEFVNWHSRNYWQRNILIIVISSIAFFNCIFYW